MILKLQGLRIGGFILLSLERAYAYQLLNVPTRMYNLRTGLR